MRWLSNLFRPRPKGTVQARWLRERDQARDAGDKLAVAVKQYLDNKASAADLEKALATYCEREGWHGPACSWVKC